MLYAFKIHFDNIFSSFLFVSVGKLFRCYFLSVFVLQIGVLNVF